MPPKKKSKTTPAEIAAFRVSDYLVGEENVKFDALRVDTKMEHGQIREIVGKHVEDLVADLRDNPPTHIDLTCWKDPGLHHSCSGR